MAVPAGPNGPIRLQAVCRRFGLSLYPARRRHIAHGRSMGVAMYVSWLRLLPAAVALGLAALFAAAYSAAPAAPPPPLNEGPAGPPALLQNGQVAQPPLVTAPQVSTSCPAAPYGSNSAAPGSGKTVALTFDDGPGASTASILSVLESFFNISQNAAAQGALARREAREGYLLGNHTWDHPDMTTLPASAQATEM